jgi:hypothetical protein
MSDSIFQTAVFGDGVLTVSIHERDEEMAADGVDLPSNIAAQLQLESIGNIQANNRDGRNVSTTALGVLQAASARNFDELGAVESRATSGVIATPVASPTTQTGS